MYTNPRQAAQAERTRRTAKVTGIPVTYRSNGKTFTAHVRTTRNATGMNFTAQRGAHNTDKNRLHTVCLYPSFDALHSVFWYTAHGPRGLRLNERGKARLHRLRARRAERGLPSLTPGPVLRTDRALWTPDVLRALQLAAEGHPDAAQAAREVLATHT